jgi:eukaryotic-like serine/threonine-protein kinase
MRRHVTLFRPDAPRPGETPVSAALPPDLHEQVRGRVRLLAILLFLAFSLDVVIFAVKSAAARVAGLPPSADVVAGVTFQWVNLGAAAASFAVWWLARKPALSSPSRLLGLGLAYEIAICFVIATQAYSQFYAEKGILPNLTWVPAMVIMFPLILPGPPRRLLAAAVASAGMAPLALLVLHLRGAVVADADTYATAFVTGAVAVAFAYAGARIVYGLGKEVAAARELGAYHLEHLLGRGGMGEVWRARHRMLARPAAIKLIRAWAAVDGRPSVSEEAVRRFEREAQAIASLRSPHTVDLFDFGVAQDGAFYYVMELLEGYDAETLVERFGPLPPERVVHLLRQVCHSLSEAEARGLVHRDIKPANIFLCRYGEDHDFVKVLDFGLVRALGEPVAAGPALTNENLIRGTPAFMAPEQITGDRELDGRVDIYAAGCVAYWLLTGRFVFEGASPMDVLVKHAATPATPPSARSEQEIPAALDELVLSCLAKDPADRPQTARELSHRLAEVAVADAWTEERARDWWSRHRPESSA